MENTNSQFLNEFDKRKKDSKTSKVFQVSPWPNAPVVYGVIWKYGKKES